VRVGSRRARRKGCIRPFVSMLAVDSKPRVEIPATAQDKAQRLRMQNGPPLSPGLGDLHGLINEATLGYAVVSRGLICPPIDKYERPRRKPA
jgi:hypothetical protein